MISSHHLRNNRKGITPLLLIGSPQSRMMTSSLQSRMTSPYLRLWNRISHMQRRTALGIKRVNQTIKTFLSALKKVNLLLLKVVLGWKLITGSMWAQTRRSFYLYRDVIKQVRSFWVTKSLRKYLIQVTLTSPYTKTHQTNRLIVNRLPRNRSKSSKTLFLTQNPLMWLFQLSRRKSYLQSSNTPR